MSPIKRMIFIALCGIAVGLGLLAYCLSGLLKLAVLP